MEKPSSSGRIIYTTKALHKKRVDSCFVPMCPSNSVIYPDKLFLTGPSDPKTRNKWFQAAKRDDIYSPKSTIKCCEDHFDLEKDVKNWVKFKLAGGNLFLKKNVVPHYFTCQNRKVALKPRSAIIKRNRREVLESIEDPPSVAMECSPIAEVDSSENIENISNDVPAQDPMSDCENICRVCLHTDRHLEAVDHKLLELHNELCDYALETLDPQYCAECICLLKKTFKFKIKCEMAIKVYKSWRNNELQDHKLGKLYQQLPPTSLGVWVPSKQSKIVSCWEKTGPTSDMAKLKKKLPNGDTQMTKACQTDLTSKFVTGLDVNSDNTKELVNNILLDMNERSVSDNEDSNGGNGNGKNKESDNNIKLANEDSVTDNKDSNDIGNQNGSYKESVNNIKLEIYEDFATDNENSNNVIELEMNEDFGTDNKDSNDSGKQNRGVNYHVQIDHSYCKVLENEPNPSGKPKTEFVNFDESSNDSNTKQSNKDKDIKAKERTKIKIKQRNVIRVIDKDKRKQCVTGDVFKKAKILDSDNVEQNCETARLISKTLPFSKERQGTAPETTRTPRGLVRERGRGSSSTIAPCC